MKGLTARQLELLQSVKAGSPDGIIDFDQLLASLSWRPTKESAQFVIRALVRKGFLQKCEPEFRRGRMRVRYILTAEGEVLLDPRLAKGDMKGEGLPDLATLPEVSDDLQIPDTIDSTRLALFEVIED